MLTTALQEDMVRAKSQIEQWADMQKESINQLEVAHLDTLKGYRGEPVASVT
jgi:hypothetical protein